MEYQFHSRPSKALQPSHFSNPSLTCSPYILIHSTRVMYLHALATSQQWSSLSVLANNVTALEWVLAENAWSGNSNGDDEEESHDCESLDPLYGNNDGEKLGDTEGSTQNTQAETHSPILEYKQVEAAVNSPCPNEDVGNNSSSEVMRMHSCSSIPVKCNEGPSQWTSENTNVCDDRRTRICGKFWRIAEICHSQLEEVDHDQQKCPPEVASAPKVNEAKEKQVVGNEPWRQIQCRCQCS